MVVTGRRNRPGGGWSTWPRRCSSCRWPSCLGLGAILGYLLAGIAIGPWGLKLRARPEAILHGAEFGVVLMLFLVGLELEPRRLWAMRRAMFGWGGLQLLGSTALLAALGLGAGPAAGQ
jgi:glutathione-regulated potassium-efflux system ancillary protein KefC